MYLNCEATEKEEANKKMIKQMSEEGFWGGGDASGAEAEKFLK
jgi:hypothetical protein